MEALILLVFLNFITNIEAVEPKSVNLALETVLQFDRKNSAVDVNFIDNVQEFLDKVKTVIDPNKPVRRSSKENENIKFTDFLKSALDILRNYDDEDLEDAFAVFNDEVRKYHYKGCKFYELVEDHNVRRFVANKLDDVKDKPAKQLRQNIDDAIQVLKDSELDARRTEFLDYVNSLYRKESNDKLQDFLNNLETYSSKSKRANLDLIKMVRHGLRSVIFDHYSALNANARRNLKIKLETSWRNVKYPDVVEHNIWTVKYTNEVFDAIKLFTKIGDRTKGNKRDLTTSPVTQSPIREPVSKHYSASTEVNQDEKYKTSTARHKKKSHKKHKEDEEVYFSEYKPHKDHDYNKEFTTELATRSSKVRLPKRKKPTSSDFSNEKFTTHQHKTKSRPKKHKIRTKQDKDRTKKQETSKKHIHSHRKLSTFVTIYPRHHTIEPTKQSENKTKSNKNTRHENKKKKSNKHSKLKRWKSRTKLRAENQPLILQESDTIINVKKAVLSEEDNASFESGRNYKTSRRTKSSANYKTRHNRKTTKGKTRLTTANINPKYVPRAIAQQDAQSGMSIESFEIERRVLKSDILPINHLVSNNNTSDQNEIKHNVLRRINNLEKQIKELNIIIATKPTAIDRTLSKQTDYTPTLFWKATTARTKNNIDVTKTHTVTTTASTTSSPARSTQTSTKPTQHHVTTLKTTTSKTIPIFIKSKATETTTKSTTKTTVPTTESTTKTMTKAESTKKHTTTTEIIKDMYADVPVQNKHNLPDMGDDPNDLGIDLDNDIDGLMKKYNLSATPSLQDKSFDYNKFLEETKPDINRPEEVKTIIENDMKKLYGEETTVSVSERDDAYRDLNAVLDLMR